MTVNCTYLNILKPLEIVRETLILTYITNV